ncbi:carbohydrate kinase [Lachnoanaerobaculum sp. Marseille-Q4761]|uniref:carbohydrate kinase family protein n=1 Tax=Lachnoanaerobaculum sp. Marseille-Q4761 TaxID=2819511 RepID=UPI001AA1523D|nr:carbohydrate kinase [Lachnoanaerobaculum sp. Marseille-Q4761]MBO1871201.1 carbohydrate kinase [Lachnoanaerobaculum sp. Marseille-Q4761]
MKKFDVVALGELLIDFTPAGLSATGMRLFEQNPGGAPANMLTAVSRAGLKTAFIGKIGADMHGDFLRSVLESVPIDTGSLITDPSVFTTLAFVSLSITGERGFSFARKPGADTKLCIEEINKDILADTKIFHVGSLSLTDEPSRSATFEAVRIAKEAGAIISYDPNYREPLWDSVENAVEMMRLMSTFADIMKISDEETSLLTPYNEPLAAGKYLVENGIKLVVVTLGEKGALAVSKTGYVEVPGFKSNVVDTTGAGDSFWGGLVARFLNENVDLDNISTKQMYDIARYGNAVASLCVEKRGGIVSIPTFDEVLERLKQ